jgi:hypothetical protein
MNVSPLASGSPRSPPAEASHGDEDAPFRSPALSAKVREHYLWHGDLLAGRESFSSFRAWLEERLPRVTQTPEGYFTAALVRPGAAARS